jgi:hypothetical protein
VEEIEARVSRLEAAVARIEATQPERCGVTVGEFRQELASQPEQRWTDDGWRDFTRLVGAGEGPPDLAAHSRRYLRGDLP